MTLRHAVEGARHGLFRTASEPLTARGALSEGAFHQMLSVERKRTERSRNPFLLMLFSKRDDISAKNEEGTLDTVLRVLSLEIRETDVVGWYRNNLIVGVIFTEIDSSEKQDVLNAILSTIRKALQKKLSLAQFNQISISFHWFPEEWEQVRPRKPNAPVLYPDLARRNGDRTGLRMVKRFTDILGSLLALIVGSPIFAAVALLIKLTSKGPVFFRQKRVGQYGIPFSLLKFRSMKVNNNESAHKEYVCQLISGVAERKPTNGNGQSVYKLTSDPRITTVGSFLRKSSLDELPQFINVLRGEMSLVGPRPPIVYEFEKYDLWHRRRVMEVKPGITGLWQVNGRNRLEFNAMVRLDLLYARSWSPWLDLKILLRTPKAVIAGAH